MTAGHGKAVFQSRGSVGMLTVNIVEASSVGPRAMLPPMGAGVGQEEGQEVPQGKRG